MFITLQVKKKKSYTGARPEPQKRTDRNFRKQANNNLSGSVEIY